MKTIPLNMSCIFFCLYQGCTFSKSVSLPKLLEKRNMLASGRMNALLEGWLDLGGVKQMSFFSSFKSTLWPLIRSIAKAALMSMRHAGSGWITPDLYRGLNHTLLCLCVCHVFTPTSATELQTTADFCLLPFITLHRFMNQNWGDQKV